MSEKIDVTVVVDDSQLQQSKKEVAEHVTDSNKKLKQLDSETNKSFNHVMGMMRASYMVISGISQAIGGNLGQVFSAMYGVGIAAVGTYQAIATAMAGTGVGIPQAMIMEVSLATALFQLISVLSGQDELTRSMSGLTMGLHGISGLINTYSNW